MLGRQGSHIVEEEIMYARFNEKGETKLVSERDIVPGYSYRRVHYTREREQRDQIPPGGEFSDPEYPKSQITSNELSRLDEVNPRIVLERLYNLYRIASRTQKLEFFPTY